MPIRSAQAQWKGSLREGKGQMSLAGGAYSGAYSFSSRFEEGAGTNPEELIAAAHAGCFSMALSAVLGDAGYEPKSVSTTAKVSIEKSGQGFAIIKSELQTTAEVPGIDEAEFKKLASAAKEGCPVSKALAGLEITLDAKLIK